MNAEVSFRMSILNALGIFAFCAANSLPLPGRELVDEVSFPIPKVPQIHTGEGECRERTFRFVIDSGSLNTIIDSHASHLYGDFIKTASMFGERGLRDGVEIREGIPLSLRGNPLALSPVAVTSLESLVEGTGLKLDALIGVRQLRFSRLWISNSTGQLRLVSREQAEETQSWKSAPLVEPFDGVHVALALEGRTLVFLVDTGNNGSISLENEVFTSLVDEGVIQPRDNESVAYDILGRKKTAQMGVFRKGEFMGIRLAGHTVSSSDERNLVGLQWLFEFDCLFDFPGMQFRFHARSDTPNLVDLAPLLGAALRFDVTTGEAIVETILETSPLAESGIKQGDRILKFGMLEGEDMNIIRLSEYVQELPPEEIPVTIRGKADSAVRELRVKFSEFPRIRRIQDDGDPADIK